MVHRSCFRTNLLSREICFYMYIALIISAIAVYAAYPHLLFAVPSTRVQL